MVMPMYMRIETEHALFKLDSNCGFNLCMGNSAA